MRFTCSCGITVAIEEDQAPGIIACPACGASYTLSANAKPGQAGVLTVTQSADPEARGPADPARRPAVLACLALSTAFFLPMMAFIIPLFAWYYSLTGMCVEDRVTDFGIRMIVNEATMFFLPMALIATTVLCLVVRSVRSRGVPVIVLRINAVVGTILACGIFSAPGGDENTKIILPTGDLLVPPTWQLDVACLAALTAALIAVVGLVFARCRRRAP